VTQQRHRSNPPKAEPLLNLPPVIVAILALVVLVHIGLTYFVSPKGQFLAIYYFGFTPRSFVADHTLSGLLSLISHSFLHGNWLHLGFNMIWFVIFGAPLANTIGTVRLLLLWLLSAALAALTHLTLHYGSPVPMIGASGAVSGIMGGAARYGFHRQPYSRKPIFSGPLLPIQQSLRERHIVIFLGLWLVGNVATGLFSSLPDTDLNAIAWEAHIGGLIAGFLMVGLPGRRKH